MGVEQDRIQREAARRAAHESRGMPTSTTRARERALWRYLSAELKRVTDGRRREPESRER